MNFGYKGISSYFRINIKEAFMMFMLKKPEIIFIDVREPFYWKEGVIPDSLQITLEDFDYGISTLDKEKYYILVCGYGGRSSLACNIMTKKGFNNVYNLPGGMLEWVDKKYPLEFKSEYEQINENDDDEEF